MGDELVSAPPPRQVRADLDEMLPFIVHLPDRCGKLDSRGVVHWCLGCQYEWADGQAHSTTGMGQQVSRTPTHESDPTHNTVVDKAKLVRAMNDAARHARSALNGLRTAHTQIEEAMQRADPPHRTPEIEYPVGRSVPHSDLVAYREAQQRRLAVKKGWGSG